ncbi:MAG: helix-turn-helix domain-containing protein, partial [Ktedonobacteraceae bacterium]|nr:helix-turn-helix domain-containing protein [Ktedonobacteraceae bacterium]
MKTNKLLQQARLAGGWTQRSLADELKVEEQTVSSWERGIRSPYPETRARLCEVLQMTPEELGFTTGKQQEPVRKDLNRQRMIQRVRTVWMTGGLYHSPGSRLIRPDFQERPDALANPWQPVIQQTNDLPATSLPSGTTVTRIFEEAGGGLLILGEPGAGKTTLLLTLARDLLAQAEQDEDAPIPAIFHLSSWAEKRQPLQDWLVEELNRKYLVPQSLAASWITDDRLLLFLDELDEVAETHRAACVVAINDYREQQGMIPLVVCCRSADYFRQPAHLLLHRAVVVQPLTREQCDRYLSHDKQFAGLRAALRTDPILQEVVSNPLMLNVCATVYQNRSREEVLSNQDVQQSLIERYVMHAWRRGPQASQRYPAECVISVLTWLAKQMHQRDLTEFYLERLQ